MPNLCSRFLIISRSTVPQIFISSDDQIRPSHEAVLVDVDLETAAAALPSGETQSAYAFDTVFDAHCFNEVGTIPEGNTEGLMNLTTIHLGH